MGSSTSKNNFSEFNIEDFHKNYKSEGFIGNSSDQIYVNQLNKRQRIALLPRECSVAYKEELDSRINFKHENILKMLGYELKDEEGFCGGSSLNDVTVFSEIYNHTLTKEIAKRKQFNVIEI